LSPTNTSTLTNPTHTFSNSGSYTVSVIYQFDCWSDTIKEVITIPAPLVSVSGNFTICNGENTLLSASGGDTFSWSSGQTSSTVALSPVSTSVYSVTVTNTTTGCSSSQSVSVVVSACTLVKDEGSLGDIQIFPNPAENVLKVETEHSLKISLYDLTGRQVKEQLVPHGKTEIDISDLTDGLYLGLLKSETSEQAFKIIKTTK
jgi:hypothetical protein